MTTAQHTNCHYCARVLEDDECETGLCTSDDCPRHDCLEWSALWAAMDATPDAWIPTTEDMYCEMLECVPPRAFVPGCFLVGEAERHNDEGKAVHACFKQSGSQFFAKYMTVEQFRGGAL